MINLIQYIYEAQIDGLKNVETIRHYTTGSALKNILRLGYIEANKSTGDKDWKDYDLIDYNVVSFHDVRTDPEWDQFIKSNDRRISMEGLTPTLGLHQRKVCACIEIDYNKLPQLIQDKTHLLNIYGRKAKDFCNLWNHVIKDVHGSNALYSVRIEIINLVKEANEKAENGDTELKDSLKHLWSSYSIDKRYKDSESKPAWDRIENIFKKYYPNTDLYKEIDQYAYSDSLFITDETRIHMRNIHYEYPFGDEGNDELDRVLKKSKQLLSFFNRTNLKQFNDDEVEELAEYAMKFDVINIIKMLAKHGWRFGDHNIGTMFWGKGYGADGKIYDGTLIRWIDELTKNKNRIINADIEIRIASNVKINKENCKIIIFDGICEATEQTDLNDLPDKYYKKYNIEHISPKK